MTDAPVLLSEDIDTTRLLTLNRPKALNALNTELVGAVSFQKPLEVAAALVLLTLRYLVAPKSET